METGDQICISVEEMGRRIGVSRVSAYDLARSEGFPSIRVGKRLLIPVRELQAWLAKQAGKGERRECV